jgi:predicted nucleotidyltransferase
MKENRLSVSRSDAVRLYRSPNIPLAAIRRYARQVGESFHPEKIILFGSYAYGRPHEDSDVDLLVIMPARNQHDQAVKIRWEFPAPFPMDLIVRTPMNLQWLLDDKESFHTEITSKGKVLYEEKHRRMGAQGRSRSNRRPKVQSKRSTPTRRAAWGRGRMAL